MNRKPKEKGYHNLVTTNSEDQNTLHDISLIHISSNLPNEPQQGERLHSSSESFKTPYEYHYELKLVPHPYDFYFNSLNYSPKLFQASSSLQAMPRHLRNTLFINNDKLKQLRKKNFSELFIIAEEIKEKGNKLFNDDYYQEALNKYIKAYSLYKWIEFTNKDKEHKVLGNCNELTANPIIDSDIRKRTCRIQKKTKLEEDTYNFTMTTLLKAMSSCYIRLLAYSEAIKCLDEAFEYSDNTKPDIYYRRAQARMYNKTSTKEKLALAEADFIEALKRKQGDNRIEEEYNTLKALIRDKEASKLEAIRKLIHNVFYADSVIRTKHLQSSQIYCKNYDMNHLNYNIMKEMKQGYYGALRHYAKTENSIEYSKGLKEYEAFLDGFYQYQFYYDLDASQLVTGSYRLTPNDVRRVEQIKHCESLLNLFDDFKFKKCDDVYLGIHLNQSIWEKSYAIVTEREKLHNSSIETYKPSYLKTSLRRLKNCVEFENVPHRLLYLLACLLFILNLFLFLPKLLTYFA